MSLFRTLDRTSAVSNTSGAHVRPFLTFLYPRFGFERSEGSSTPSAITKRLRHTSHALHEDIFIRALTRAGSCGDQARQFSTASRGKPYYPNYPPSRGKSTWQKPGQPAAKGKPELKVSAGPIQHIKQFAKDELKALVDYYGIKIDTRPEENTADDGQELLIWNVGDVHQPLESPDTATSKAISRLERLLEDDEASHDEVWDLYKKLPGPGVAYLEIQTVRSFLRHMAVVERPTILAMQRFLSALDDMKIAQIHIISSEWTSAIHLAGKAMGQASTDNLHTALRLWRDMEHRAQVKSGYVTLSVLFDVAVKNGKYELAESFLTLLKQRQLSLHRHFRISLIYYYGVLQNGQAVRKAYQDLIDAGDIVDCVVLNSVIAALIRAGEPAAAEHVFERMKRLHATRRVAAPGHRFLNRMWRDRRELGLMLTHEARRLNRAKNPEAVKQLQDYAPIAPNSRTYGLLIRYHATTSGDLDRVYDLLSEMHYNSIPLEGIIFITIFQGFSSFGGIRYSPWSRDKLEKTWNQYIKALQDGLDRTWISTMSVIAVLKAFARCTDPERTLRAWEEVRKLWNPTEAEFESVMEYLRKVTPQQPNSFDSSPHL